MALGLRAEVTKKAAGTVTEEDLVYGAGLIFPLAHVSVSALVIKTKEATPKTLVAYGSGADTTADGKWDYKVNDAAGSVQWATTPKTAGLTAKQVVTAAYSYAGQQIVQPFTKGSIERFLRFEGLNTAEENKPVVVEVFRWSADPAKALDLINDNVANMPLSASALMDNTRPAGESKFFRQILAD